MTHVVVHDYSGHPGQAQLSRALARRGFRVTHQHCPSYTSGRGAVEPQPGDPAGLAFEPCPMRGTFARYSAATRLVQELSYGRSTGRRLAERDPDVVVCSNIPLLAHLVVAWHLRRRRIPMVFWHQDVYSAAIGAAARRRLPGVGAVVARLAEAAERTVARWSGAVVAISPAFLEPLTAWGVADRSVVVPNWAPLDELPEHPRDNPWAREHDLVGRPVVLYSGTLGLKHDPSILAEVSSALAADDPDARLVVISEGQGRQWLEGWRAQTGATNLVLLDYQPYERLPEVLASADVLVVVLEPDASRYSVPSKALTYLCARRPVLGIMPADNAVALVLAETGAGAVVDPRQREEVGPTATALLRHGDLRRRMGDAGRAYAEATFSPDRAAEQFEAVFRDRLTIPPTMPSRT